MGNVQISTIEKINRKKNIAIIMGGYSSEYQISLNSGRIVYENLSQEKFNIFEVHILKNKWVHVDRNGNEFPIDKNDFTVFINGNKTSFDCVFNAIHGVPGENGIIQAYLSLLNLPHTSCDSYQAAITFNKRDCLSILKSYGIKTAESFYLNFGEPINEKEIITKVGLPCFVKPNKSGSSFGITKVLRKKELHNAIKIAFKEDDEIIIESFIDGTEVSVGVLIYQGDIKVLPITEIVSKNDFFDFGAKYLGESQEITPARLSNEQEKKINKVAKRIFQILKIKGFSRSEFIIKNGDPHFLEINTVPGLTKESILPQQAAVAGITLEQLFNNAIEEALK